MGVSWVIIFMVICLHPRITAVPTKINQPDDVEMDAVKGIYLKLFISFLVIYRLLIFLDTLPTSEPTPTNRTSACDLPSAPVSLEDPARVRFFFPELQSGESVFSGRYFSQPAGHPSPSTPSRVNWVRPPRNLRRTCSDHSLGEYLSNLASGVDPSTRDGPLRRKPEDYPNFFAKTERVSTEIPPPVPPRSCHSMPPLPKVEDKNATSNESLSELGDVCSVYSDSRSTVTEVPPAATEDNAGKCR